MSDFSALQELTAADLNDHFDDVTPLFVRKTTDETVNNDATLQNDNVLVRAVQANATYLVDLRLIINTNATADFKFTFTAPSGASGSVHIFEGSSPTSAATVLQGPFSITATLSVSGVAADQIILVQGVVVISSTSGNLQFQWAQNTANASDTSVKTNSYLHLTKVA